jgi:hypothetical protein
VANAPWLVEEYRTVGGRSLIRDFIEGLNARNKVEAIALIKLVEERGNTLRPPHSKSLGEGLYELRGKVVRIFYLFRPNRRIVLLDGLVKRRRSIPEKDLEHARALQRKVLESEPDGGSQS